MGHAKVWMKPKTEAEGTEGMIRRNLMNPRKDLNRRIPRGEESQEFIGSLKMAQGLAWGFMLSILLWLIFGVILVVCL